MPTPTTPARRGPRGARSGPPGGLCLALSLLLLVGAVGGCTGDEPDASPQRPSPTASAAPAAPTSAPLTVRVTRVSGRLPAASRGPLETNVGRTLRSFVDGGFLAGDYPRSDFDAAFADFTPGAAKRARGDVELLTNASYGAATTSVRAVKGTAYLSVLAPAKVAAGVTAQVDLVFRVERGDEVAQQVRLRGRLLLTRGSDNAWKVFGYHLDRSDTPAGGAS